MKSESPSMTRISAVIFIAILLCATCQWSINRFVLYHTQNRVLQPSDYTVSVAPVASKSGSDHQLSDDGQFAVQVITRGTSHAMDQITQSLLPVFVLSLIGLVALALAARRGRTSPA